MIFTELSVPGVWRVDIEPHVDDRGFFARTWEPLEFAARGLADVVSMCGTSFNPRRGTLRGLHYQESPHEEVKVVRCTAGRIFDVAIDLRAHSETYCHWVGVELTAESRSALYIPRGCAHGFQTLTDEVEVLYQITGEYLPTAARGVRWDDPAFGVTWPIGVTVINERDASYPDFVPSEARAWA